jgi:hypothetical protein
MLLIRRLRGILGTAVAWGLGWSAIALPIFIAVVPGSTLFGRVLPALRMASYAGMAGAVSGASFAVLVLVLERRRTLTAFSTRRAALWGALAGGGYSVVALVVQGLARFLEPTAVVSATLLVGGVLGAATGSLMLLLARRATERSGDSVPTTGARELGGPSVERDRATFGPARP